MTSERGRSIWTGKVGLADDGPNGHVQPQRILEWMQDAAANASTLGGYPPDRYKVMGAAWFIKEVLLAIDAPIRYGDPIEIETWVSDLRRFRSRREYRVSSNQKIVARAQADWLLLEQDPKTGKVRPLRVDEEMSGAFPRIPETVLGERDLETWADDEPASIQRCARSTFLAADTRRVRPTELDRHGHVNHTIYLGWLEDHARAALGDEQELRSVRVEYQNDAKLGDEIVIIGHADGDAIRQSAVRLENRGVVMRPVFRATSRRVRGGGWPEGE